ncbi:hypothetical protein [Krasilnikovia sp. MM14-A1259]|uniref:hypothetical protein n=1 Tax=Krasilnikovia sp. MM14-A1259 TaxID=3373539 RepID=UPI00381CFEBA
MSGSRRVRALLSVLLLGGAWVFAPARIPLYDGLGFPDEPYRYVQPPPGSAATAAPTTATGSAPASGGANREPMRIASAEVGPQVVVSVPAGDLLGPPATTRLTLTARPVAPDRAPPAGVIDGNVYRVGATADASGPVRLRVTDPNYLPGIDLRATVATPAKVTAVYRDRPAAPWSVLIPVQVGNDIYEMVMPGLGDFALVLPSAAPPATVAPRPGSGPASVGPAASGPGGIGPGSAPPPSVFVPPAAPAAGGHPLRQLIGLAVVLLVLGACIVGIRVIRSRDRDR